jgi:hypothetical protein
MGAMIRLYIDIALWRRGPQEVPMAAPILPVTALVYFLISVASVWLASRAMPLPETSGRQAEAWLIAADVLFLCAWYWWLLRAFGRVERYRQTISAVFGVAALLELPSVMVVQLLLSSSSDKAGTLAIAASIATLVMVIWALLANAHILRHAIEKPLRWCVALVILLQVCEQLLALLLLPTGK